MYETSTHPNIAEQADKHCTSLVEMSEVGVSNMALTELTS